MTADTLYKLYRDKFDTIIVGSGASGFNAANRLFERGVKNIAIVTEDIYDEVVEEFIEQYKNYPVGDPKDESTVVGPLSSKKQFEKVCSYIKKGIDEGAKLICGEVPKKEKKGYYVKPVIFTNVKAGMTIHDEEIFGPVLSIIKVKILFALTKLAMIYL